MSTEIVWQSIGILVLILANGVFAMSEIAMLSANKNRLKQMADDGSAGAKAALQLSESPTRFLSTVQVGITLVGVLTGAISGATIGQVLADALSDIPVLAPYAEALGVGIVVVVITYLTLLFGELVPKRLGLNNPTAVSVVIARPMNLLSKLASPIVRFLSLSTDTILKLLNVPASPDVDITVEDVEMLIEEGTHLGVFEAFEREIAGRVFDLADLPVSLLMTPRTDIVWLDVNDPPDVNLHKMAESRRSFYPVGDRSLDHMVGFVAAKDVLVAMTKGQEVKLDALASPPLFVPESTPALDAIERLKQAGQKRAMVINEYGGIEGLVTIDDLIEAMVGYIEEADEPPEPEIVQRDDGSWLIDARLPAERLKELFRLESLPGESEASYETVGGFVMMMLGRVPQEADRFEMDSLSFEVVDMDGRRVDKVVVKDLRPPSKGPDDQAAELAPGA